MQSEHEIQFYEIRVSHSEGEAWIKTINRNGKPDVIRTREEVEMVIKKIKASEDFFDPKLEVVECTGAEKITSTPN